ncbi:hypothetical protein N7453_001973 [Penicillium expansum]|nr:hypothetical protein N7453_001973 [Penicillium expansum]
MDELLSDLDAREAAAHTISVGPFSIFRIKPGIEAPKHHYTGPLQETRSTRFIAGPLRITEADQIPLDTVRYCNDQRAVSPLIERDEGDEANSSNILDVVSLDLECLQSPCVLKRKLPDSNLLASGEWPRERPPSILSDQQDKATPLPRKTLSSSVAIKDVFYQSPILTAPCIG